MSTQPSHPAKLKADYINIACQEVAPNPTALASRLCASAPKETLSSARVTLATRALRSTATMITAPNTG
jgi:hypothetical protein